MNYNWQVHLFNRQPSTDEMPNFKPHPYTQVTFADPLDQPLERITKSFASLDYKPNNTSEPATPTRDASVDKVSSWLGDEGSAQNPGTANANGVPAGEERQRRIASTEDVAFATDH
ncbi:hypothetical protein HDV00_001686 [Rhizophlyctis rosea]|nr:hypothetical protein HDV00_001686 [Rhizophlyctis rosea]